MICEDKIMNFCVNLQFLQDIRSADLLTYLALLLAYIAYVWSVNRDLDFWKSLLISFKSDLENQKFWLASEYFAETYKDKNSFNPYKIIFPLSFESLPEIIRKGIAEFSWISRKFINRLSLFNERVITFNDLLDHLKKSITADPILSERLKDKLNELGLDKESIEFDVLKNKIFDAKKTDEDFYLAEQVRKFNYIIHVKIISDRNNEDKLYFLYSEISKELDYILKRFDKERPYFIRYKWLFVLASIPVFVFIELFFR